MRFRMLISVDVLARDPTAWAILREEVHFELEDDALVPFALDGDRKPLISYIEKGGDINGDIRNFILDVLKGKVRRPNNRPRHAATLLSPAHCATRCSQRISETTVHGLVEPVMRRGGL